MHTMAIQSWPLLCFLIIIGVTIVPTSAETNQLKLTNCSQSSSGGPCERAIDGNTNQGYFGNSCSQTNWDLSWWKASTESRAQFRKVKIYSPNYCCADSRNYFFVTVDDQRCASYGDLDYRYNTFKPRLLTCDKIGQVIMIKSAAVTFLSLCEVLVFGELLNKDSKFHLRHLAVGCFEDGMIRDLPILVSYSWKMTAEMCLAQCKVKEFKFAGLRAGTQCWCGQKFGRYGNAAEDKCNTKCMGNGTQICGGPVHNFIYATSKPNVEQLALGCYKDEYNHDLETRIEYSRTAMTVEKCLMLCQWKKFKFAGLQLGIECWCGQRFGNYGKAAAEKCDRKCSGDNAKICGGVWHNSIYATTKTDQGNLLP